MTSASGDSAATWLVRDDVAFLPMLAEVEPLNLVLLAGSQAHQGVDHLENDERADDGQRQRGSGCDDLIDQLLRVSLDQSALSFTGDLGTGKNAGQQGSRQAANAWLLSEKQRCQVEICTPSKPRSSSK